METKRYEVVLLPISLLPIGCHPRNVFESLVIDPTTAHVCVVAVEGYAGDWAAYIGWPRASAIRDGFMTPDIQRYCATVSSPEDVMNSGDKLAKLTAEEIFPSWKDRRYRS